METPPGAAVRPATGDDLPAWHRARWIANADNGEGGVHFAPRRNGAEPWTRSREAEDRDLARLCLSPREVGWLRLWLAHVGGDLVGHVTLAGASYEAALHRAVLGIGLVRGHRGRGLGSALLDAALTWARATPELRWIDLAVFSTNPRAERLYRRFGFVEEGRSVDDLRIDGASIDQIYMTLRLTE